MEEMQIAKLLLLKPLTTLSRLGGVGLALSLLPLPAVPHAGVELERWVLVSALDLASTADSGV